MVNLGFFILLVGDEGASKSDHHLQGYFHLCEMVAVRIYFLNGVLDSFQEIALHWFELAYPTEECELIFPHEPLLIKSAIGPVVGVTGVPAHLQEP